MGRVEAVAQDDIIAVLTGSAVAAIECTAETVLLNDRYICCEQIGEGGLSLVYKAKDSYAEYFRDEKNIAVKMPTDKLLTMKDIAAFVYSEYKILSQLQHPNIVKVLDFGINKPDGIPYIILERLEGKLLDEVPLHTLTPTKKMQLFDLLGEAIAYIHMQGVVHADIAPNNIMILDNGSMRLFDFGIAQMEGSGEKFQLDFSKMRAFNPKYAAPELLAEGIPTRESDIFSFACVMYELFTGSLPFEECSSELYEKGVTKSQLRRLPREVRKWFDMALNTDPGERDHTLKRCQKFSIFGWLKNKRMQIN